MVEMVCFNPGSTACESIEKQKSMLPPVNPRHTGRGADDLQPCLREREKMPPHQCWVCEAFVWQQGIGKASKSRYAKQQQFTAASRAEVVRLREQQWVTEYLHPRPVSNKREREEAAAREIVRRQAAPKSFKEPMSGGRGPSTEQARAGPGRDHQFEPAENTTSSSRGTVPYMLPLDDPPLANPSEGWLQQLSLKKQWQTKQMERQNEHIKELEASLV